MPAYLHKDLRYTFHVYCALAPNAPAELEVFKPDRSLSHGELLVKWENSQGCEAKYGLAHSFLVYYCIASGDNENNTDCTGNTIVFTSSLKLVLEFISRNRFWIHCTNR